VRKCFISYHMLNCSWRRSRHTNEQKKAVYYIMWYIYILNYYLDTWGDLLWCSGKAAVKWGGCGNNWYCGDSQNGRCFWCCGVIPTVGGQKCEHMGCGNNVGRLCYEE
jgi:hypothetical protein